MALTQKLLDVLENLEEPLAKRLKIADNAFKSVDLPMQHREAVLLKWLGKVLKNKHENVWSVMLNWLSSQQMQDLSRNDVSQEDIKNIMTVITKYSKHCPDQDTLISCALSTIENRSFQLFFKYNLEAYCDFIAKILFRIKDERQICRFLKSDQLFNKNVIGSDEFYGHFIGTCLPCLAELMKDNEVVFVEVAKIVERCLFHRNFKNFAGFLKYLTEDVDNTNDVSQLPKLLLKSMIKTENPNLLYKLIFYCYCNSFSNDFLMIYKFFIIILQTLGFDIANYYGLQKFEKYRNRNIKFNVSINILIDLCEVLAKHSIDINATFKGVTFSYLLTNLALAIISLTKNPNRDVLKFLSHLIVLDPLILEKILSDILIYIMLSNKDSIKSEYETFFISLFEVFAKLYRIPNLISKMIPTVKMAVEGGFTFSESPLKIFIAYEDEANHQRSFNVQDMLPEGVLKYFTQCITTLASWQVMNLFKTFLFHLKSVMEEDLLTADESKITYIEMISILLCQFFCSVRIAEHTVPTVMVEKFVKGLDELKDILARFGPALVKMEHNPVLMRTYLSLCYSWGELYMILAYYSNSDEVTLQKTLDNDSSACNLTYLHPYLTRDQWCLISQRIANFGEKPCKLVMNKLYIQKLKALLLFEQDNINEDVVANIRTSVLAGIDDNWKNVIFDPFVLDHIVSKSNSISSIADKVVQDVLKTSDYHQLDLLCDCRELSKALLYKCLYKFSKAFKSKQKQARLALILRVFSPMQMELLYADDLTELISKFTKEIELENDTYNNFIINEKDLSDYIDLLKRLPVIQDKDVQIILILFVICLYRDLQGFNLQDSSLIEKCESILIGLLQICNASFKFLTTPQIINILLNCYSRKIEIFTLILQNVLKNEDDIGFLKDIVELLTRRLHEKDCLSFVTEMLNVLNKHNKSRVLSKNSAVAEYQDEICKAFLEFIKCNNESCNVENLIELYSLTLRHYLARNSKENLQMLLPFLNKCVQEIIDHPSIKGGIILLTAILRNKSVLSNTADDIITSAWNYCCKCIITKENEEDYSKLVVLIFEHIPNEQFSEISNTLLNTMLDTIKSNDIEKFKEQLKIWSAILSCSFNARKTEMWLQVLESLLRRIIIFLENNFEIYEDVVKFEILIIQNVHLLLTSTLIESFLITVSMIVRADSKRNFPGQFSLCLSILESLLKFRKLLLMDYLPSYLQQYRFLLTKLCIHSDSDRNLEQHEVQQISDCAHKFERLTKSLIMCQKHLMRICPYLIADMLKHYEEITLLPNVKIHLNNCLYSLVSLCDQHAISYLMRILSTASTEMFKVIYDNYKKYYKFTGKV